MNAYAFSVLAVMGINVILAVSLNMITGFCGQFSLGHAAFYGSGAYAAAYLAAAGAPVPVALLAAIMVAGTLGFIVGFASLRLRDDFLAVTTIGVSFLFVGFVRKQHWLGAEMGISRIPPTGTRQRRQRAADCRRCRRSHRGKYLCQPELDGI